MRYDVIRRLVDDAYRAQESGMHVGLPRVKVDASQLRGLLAWRDYYECQANRYMKALYDIIEAWDGDEDSMRVNPAEIARAALEGNPND